MHLCYIDESGTGQVLNPAVLDSTPVMVIGGFSVEESRLPQLSWDFLELKQRFEPTLRPKGSPKRPIELIRHEIKGGSLRRRYRSGSNRNIRAANEIVSGLLNLLEAHECTVLARILVKAENEQYDEAPIYSASVRSLCENFEHLLAERLDQGVVIMDSRSKHKNVANVDGVTTSKFHLTHDRARRDLMPHIAESPVFGHSDTHLGLQIADLLVSAVLFPAACVTYSGDLSWNVHCNPAYASARTHTRRLEELQHRYRTDDGQGKWTGGVVVTDYRQRRSAADLFENETTASVPLLATVPAPQVASDGETSLTLW